MDFKPIYNKYVKLELTVAGDGAGAPIDFSCQLRSVALTPDTNIARTKTLCPEGQFAEVETSEWQLALGYLYGRHATAPEKALARFLMLHNGQKATFTYQPMASDATEGYTGTVTLIPGGIGGEQGNFSEQSVQLPVDGQPIPLAA